MRHHSTPVFDIWQDPQERYDLFMNNFTERTWTLVTISEAIKDFMKTYVQYPPRKLQSEGYSGPLTLSTPRSSTASGWILQKGRHHDRYAHGELAFELAAPGAVPRAASAVLAQPTSNEDEEDDYGKTHCIFFVDRLDRPGSAVCCGPCPGPAAFLERRQGQAGHRRIRREGDEGGRPGLRPARPTRLHLRQRRHALGRAADVFPTPLRARSREGAGAAASRVAGQRAVRLAAQG